MHREVFLDHLLRASAHCREFTTRFVFESLPSAYAFWVVLNCSYDGHPLKDGEVVFSDDVQKHGDRVGPLMADAVVSLLWRDHMVPEWIDISVWEADQYVTSFELMCCGRFTAESQRLYYRWNSFPPFGVKSPAFPPRLATSAHKGVPVEKFTLAESRQIQLLGRAPRSSLDTAASVDRRNPRWSRNRSRGALIRKCLNIFAALVRAGWRK